MACERTQGKARLTTGLPPDLHFWRDDNDLEADLLFEVDNHHEPVAIKSGRTVTPDYIRAGQKTARITGDEALTPWLIYGGDESYERSGVRVIGWRDIGNQRPGGDN
jgi:hypothetical protein